MPPPAEVRVAPLFAQERRALLDLLGSLTSKDWTRPTPCEAWTVHGLCLHLVGDDLSLLSRRRDKYHGTPMPDGLDDGTRADWLDALQQEWVNAARRMSPQVAIELLAMTGPRLEAVLAAEDPSALTAHVSWAGQDPVPVGLDHLRELSEYWVHRQQLSDALGRATDPDPVVLGAVLDGLRWAYPYGLQAVHADEGDAIEIEVHGAVAARWTLVRDRERWRFTEDASGPVVGSLRAPTEHVWRLLTNNLREADRNGLEVTGAPGVTDALVATRALIGRPKWSSYL